jgi:rhamnose transport system substrate-binding protein
MSLLKKLAVATALTAVMLSAPAAIAQTKIALVVKSLGNGFFDAANKGAQEAAKELGGVEVIYTGPTTTTAEGQIEVINSLIAQGVSAIAVSANDPDALVPALKKATQRGIKVISWDSGVAPEGRILQLNPSSNELIGKMCLTLVKDHLDGGKGDFAILSATTTSTNQNIWIDQMKKQLKDFPGLNLVTTVYGDDLSDKSYREAEGLLKANPNIKVIVAPTTVGVLAASKVVEDKGLVGKVYVTGLGLPSEMAGAIKSGATKEFAIWNPIDLGYSATQIAYRLVKGETDGKPGSEIEAGRMGKIKVGDNGEAAMADPFVYNASNIDQFSKVF